MAGIPADILLDLLAASSEPLLLVHVDSPDWPVVLANPAFESMAPSGPVVGKSFPDVIEAMVGRDMTREASAALRTQRAATLPVDVGSREYLLTLLPMPADSDGPIDYIAALWRTAGRQVPRNSGHDAFRALASATSRIRKLSGDDPVTGLMNEPSFRQVLAHDWAVAAREDRLIGLTAFTFNDFDAYRDVFGRHGADSGLKRIAKIVTRHLRRASDVAARVEGGEGGCILVLSHGSEQEGLETFAGSIAAAVHELGLHHPRSRSDRFVTVSYKVASYRPREAGGSPGQVLARFLAQT